MKADANKKAQVTGTGEVNDAERGHGPWGIQEEPNDREGETETNREKAQPFVPPRLEITDSLIRQLSPRLSQWLDIANAFQTLVGGITQNLARITTIFQDQLQLVNFQSILRPILFHPKARMAANLGWVVHHTLPTTLLDDAAEDDLDEAIMAHYKERWAEVRHKIELDTSKYLLSWKTTCTSV